MTKPERRCRTVERVIRFMSEHFDRAEGETTLHAPGEELDVDASQETAELGRWATD